MTQSPSGRTGQTEVVRLALVANGRADHSVVGDSYIDELPLAAAGTLER
jgi:hypothetical protein